MWVFGKHRSSRFGRWVLRSKQEWLQNAKLTNSGLSYIIVNGFVVWASGSPGLYVYFFGTRARELFYAKF